MQGGWEASDMRTVLGGNSVGMGPCQKGPWGAGPCGAERTDGSGQARLQMPTAGSLLLNSATHTPAEARHSGGGRKGCSARPSSPPLPSCLFGRAAGSSSSPLHLEEFSCPLLLPPKGEGRPQSLPPS